jgi:hypothetical protein
MPLNHAKHLTDPHNHIDNEFRERGMTFDSEYIAEKLWRTILGRCDFGTFIFLLDQSNKQQNSKVAK